MLLCNMSLTNSAISTVIMLLTFPQGTLPLCGGEDVRFDEADC